MKKHRITSSSSREEEGKKREMRLERRREEEANPKMERASARKSSADGAKREFPRW